MSIRFGVILRVAGPLVLLLTCLAPASAQDIDFGNYHALLIANEKYRHWTPLKTPYQDVADLEKILRERYGFKTKIIKDATRNEIVDELEALKRRLTERDNLLIYYAGHGKVRADGGYWIGVDADQDSSSRWLHYSRIRDLLDVQAGMRARHVLLIADSCYSGAALRAEEEFPEKRPDEAFVDWLQRMIRQRARTVMTSGGVQPVLDRVGKSRNSIFAQQLLAELGGNEEVMEGNVLWGRIKKEVHHRAQSVLGRDAQAPEYGPIYATGHAGGDFLFRPKDVRITEAGPETRRDWPFGIRGRETRRDWPFGIWGPDQDQLAVGVYRPKVGEVFRDRRADGSLCPKCPEMVVVPAGSFMMGSPKSEEGRHDNEGPQRRVTISQPFAVGRYEVTFDEWNACAADGSCRGRYNDWWGRGRQPVVGPSWKDAKAYVAWLSKKTGKEYRLLSEAEWEYAARAGTTTRFSFGDQISAEDATFPTVMGDVVVKTSEVGSHPANSWKLHDMHGNVWEWVEDCWNDSYRGAPTDGSAWISGDCSGRILRGGSWGRDPLDARSASRFRYDTESHYADLFYGVRVARTLP